MTKGGVQVKKDLTNKHEDWFRTALWLNTQGWGTKGEKYGQIFKVTRIWTVSIPWRIFNPVQNVLDIWLRETICYGTKMLMDILNRTKFKDLLLALNILWTLLGWDPDFRPLWHGSNISWTTWIGSNVCNHLHPVLKPVSLMLTGWWVETGL